MCLFPEEISGMYTIAPTCKTHALPIFVPKSSMTLAVLNEKPGQGYYF
jgi:hypothetical protein